MNKTLFLAKRELAGLFYSPIGYLVLTAYLLLMGILFGSLVFAPGQVADMRPLFKIGHYVAIFIIPLLTMGLLADEYSSGRIEMLRTSPISEWQIIIGKYLGALGFYLALLLSTLIYVIILLVLGKPDLGAVLSGYISLMLLGAMFVAIGLFFSAITPYQIVAAMSTFIALAVMGILMDFLSFKISDWLPPAGWFSRGLNGMLKYLAIMPRMDDFAKGVVESSNVAFFVIFSGLFLLLSYMVVESRKWR